MAIRAVYRYNLMCFKYQLRLFTSQTLKCEESQVEATSNNSSNLHCYKTVFPWKNVAEFSEHIVSSVIYNKDGLIAINKPFGIKIHGHDKPGTRSKDGQHYIIPTIKDCNFTIEDALPALKDHLNVSSLTILKSAERYTSGLVLLGTSEKVAAEVLRSCAMAKCQKNPHLIHWMVTLGFPVVPSRKEKVGIKMLEVENIKQPVIETHVSKSACKHKIIHPVNVEYVMLSVNRTLPSSLVEIACSSVKWHFVRVYASSRIATILGDIMYGSRMSTLLGVPMKIHLQNSLSYETKPLPNKMAEILNLPKGANNYSVPTMLHLRSLILPSFFGKDLVITAEPPIHFNWTLQKLSLFPE